MRLATVLAVLVLAPLHAHAQPVREGDVAAARTVTVTGRGEASGRPDMATLRFSAASRGETAVAAMNANAERMTAARDALLALGIARRDLQTASLDLNPIYAQSRAGGYDRSEVTGYEARNTLLVRLRDLSEAGAVIDAAIEAGANGLDGFNFGFEDQAELLREARRAAVADARDVAALLADEAGATLGDVVTITEQGGSFDPSADRSIVTAVRFEAPPTPIEAGEQRVTSTVNITYALR